MLQDIGHLKGRQPLRVLPDRVDADAAIVGRVGLGPFGLVSGEIGIRGPAADPLEIGVDRAGDVAFIEGVPAALGDHPIGAGRSEEHTSELQSLMRISYAVFCLKKKNIITNNYT